MSKDAQQCLRLFANVYVCVRVCMNLSVWLDMYTQARASVEFSMFQ